MVYNYKDTIDPAYAAKIVANAQELLQSGYFVPGTAAMVERLKRQGMLIEVLDLDHTGIMLLRNEREGTVLDRAGLRRALADKGLPPLDPFEYDVWAMRAAAHELAPNDPAFFFAAGDALNMTTISAIGAKDLLVVTFE